MTATSRSWPGDPTNREVELRCEGCGGRQTVDADHRVRVESGTSLSLWEWWENLRQRRCKACYERDQLNVAAGQRERDRAISRVDERADEEWRQSARQAVRDIAGRQATLTADDLWAAGLAKPREARASGPVFLWAAKQGLIEDTGRTGRTSQANCHGMPRRIWRSKIYKP
ncbi:MAG: hypothetical protein ACRDXE_08185 [Acidimicrobiales bacterium]